MEKMKNLMLECNRVLLGTPIFLWMRKKNLLSWPFHQFQKQRQLVHFHPKEEELHSLPQNPIMVPVVSHPSLDLIKKALNFHGLPLWNWGWLQKFGLLDLSILTYSRKRYNFSIIFALVWSLVCCINWIQTWIFFSKDLPRVKPTCWLQKSLETCLCRMYQILFILSHNGMQEWTTCGLHFWVC